MSQRSSGMWVRLAIGVGFALFAIISYFASTQTNPVTGEDQHISITPEQEIELGRQAAPQMAQEFGGLYPDEEVQAFVGRIGADLVNNSFAEDSPYIFEFHVLNSDIVNAFALPGGQIFITSELLSRMETEDEVAGVLGHEIMHVLGRHSAQQMAKAQLTNGLVGAVAVASGDASAAQTAAVIGQLINMRYGREDEIESDIYGVCIMHDAGYDPSAMVTVMEILRDASGGGSQPEFASTHPNPENRIERIQERLQNLEDCPD